MNRIFEIRPMLARPIWAILECENSWSRARPSCTLRETHTGGLFQLAPLPLVPFSKGRLTRIERDGQGVDYRYDRFGRMTQDGQLSYLLDKNGNRQEIGYPGGVIARYTHDYADHEATLQALVPGEPARSVITASSWLPLGPLATMTLGNGFVETHVYDTRYFPDRITITGGTPRLDWDYTVDKVGNPTLIADLLNPAQNRTYGYQDFQYYLTLGNGPWGDLSWAYDRIGNRLSETRDGITDGYIYVLNGVGGHTAKLDEIALGAGGLRAYGFDAAGNQTQVAEGADIVGMSYDDAGRLARIERPSVGFATDLLYDGRSYLRHAEETELAVILRDGFETGDFACWSAVAGGTAGGVCPAGGPSVAPTYSSEGMLHHQVKPAGVERAVLYFAGRPVAILELPASGPAEVLLLSTDHLGTPVLASTLAGGVSWSGGFEPFGADWSGAEAAGVFLRFPGQWGDAAWAAAALHNPLQYNVHRWLDFGLGRYNRPDPLSFSNWLNPFSYVANRSISYYDSLGLHLEGGPWHPDGPFACKGSDSCAELRHKISQFSHAISSHRRWDRVRGTDRHAGEIEEFINGIEECKRLYKVKGCDQPCEPCRKVLELSPVAIVGYIVYKLVEIFVCPGLVPVTP